MFPMSEAVKSNWRRQELEEMKASITQIHECLGEYESEEWCGHCIVDGKCAQITMAVNELKEKLEAVREFVLSRKYDIKMDIENFGMLKPVLSYFLGGKVK